MDDLDEQVLERLHDTRPGFHVAPRGFFVATHEAVEGVGLELAVQWVDVGDPVFFRCVVDKHAGEDAGMEAFVEVDGEPERTVAGQQSCEAFGVEVLGREESETGFVEEAEFVVGDEVTSVVVEVGPELADGDDRFAFGDGSAALVAVQHGGGGRPAGVVVGLADGSHVEPDDRPQPDQRRRQHGNRLRERDGIGKAAFGFGVQQVIQFLGLTTIELSFDDA